MKIVKPLIRPWRPLSGQRCDKDQKQKREGKTV